MVNFVSKRFFKTFIGVFLKRLTHFYETRYRVYFKK